MTTVSIVVVSSDSSDCFDGLTAIASKPAEAIWSVVVIRPSLQLQNSRYTKRGTQSPVLATIRDGKPRGKKNLSSISAQPKMSVMPTVANAKRTKTAIPSAILIALE